MTAERCLYLVRHGETTGESSIRYHGRNDVPLSDLGRAQVARLRSLVGHVPFSAVVHSPLSRAVESAQILLESLQREPGVVETAPDLTEVDFGAIEGLTAQEIAAELPEWYAAWQGGTASGFPGGEAFDGFRQRIFAAFDGLLARHPKGHVLVVVHKGVIKHGVARLLGLSPSATAKLDPELGSLSVVTCGAQNALRHWSLTPDGG